MTTTQRPPTRHDPPDDFNKIPGFEAAFDIYAATMNACMTEITASFKQAPTNNGVPPVREIMDRYEDRLSELYGQLFELYRKHHE